MSHGTLTIYSASAGSGKTYTLTGIYLSSLFQHRYNYRKILAVTFTNKATAEMKSRILENLHLLASGKNCDYLPDLLKQTKQSEEWVRKEASEILNLILHDFSRFSVSTIDSFFQKIIRAFAREAGLHSGYNIELDNEIWLDAAIDETISSANENDQLRDWLINYALSNIDNEKSWNLKAGIKHLSKELFNEKFRILSKDEMGKLEDKRFLNEYTGKLKTVVSSFEKHMKECGMKASALMTTYKLDDGMFYRKGQGVPRFVKLLCKGVFDEPGCYVREIMNDPPRWATGNADPALKAAISAGLGDILSDAITSFDREGSSYRSAKVILSNIYALGILTDILGNIRRLTSIENTFLLSDAGEFLRLITEGDQSPFIYEKAGTTYENFMIDEFQDTSMIQWKNFFPLISDSLAQGFDNLIVGDIKQSIYRWRNSDWKILRSMMEHDKGDQRIITKPLNVNWRSRSNIIAFNNSLFRILPRILDEKIGNDSISDRFDSLYSEAFQVDPEKKDGGFVHIEFIDSNPEKHWEDAVLEKLPSVIESLQDKGYSASDIGIIVRDGRQGSIVLKKLIEYSGNTSVKPNKYNFNVVSGDSLLLAGSPAVNFIVSVLSSLNDPADMIPKAAMQRFYLLSTGKSSEVQFSPSVNDCVTYFPEGYEDFLSSLAEKPLFECVERIIQFFDIGKYSWNAAWLSTFQDSILAFIKNGSADLNNFIEWWNTSGCRKSVTLPDNLDAIRIQTIHKSKGLEYRVVILPFISWELDHPPLRQPLLWVKPEVAPFDDLGVVPVRYSKDIACTIFSDCYLEEKYSIFFDNLNLLYVAATRAKDALFGFAPANPRGGNIAAVLREALTSGDSLLNDLSDAEKVVFEYGEVPESAIMKKETDTVPVKDYKVTYGSGSLRLKLHGENYFSSEDVETRKKLNYGKLMHEIFENIDVKDDITAAVRKLVLDGRLPSDESKAIEDKISSLMDDPLVSQWFSPENEVFKEADILLPSGNIKRPDRVIFSDGSTAVIDFKFGEESDRYFEQINLYKNLLTDMGFKNVKGFIWYVDKNKIVPA
ncbi:MAG TPA: UvrD-helicase domain-containing protein [Bacteroidales bacterium]|nr:UvrD-helicase domain-containing protein [Bacteroidales bacterium]